MFVGTIFFGLATDRVGRRFGFIAMLLLYSLASFAGGAGYYAVVGVAGTFVGFMLLLITRFVAGAGIGGENVVLDAYVSELVPTRIRGRSVALMKNERANGRCPFFVFIRRSSFFILYSVADGVGHRRVSAPRRFD